MVNENEKVPAADVRRWILWGAKILSYFVYVYLILVEIVLLIGFFLLLFGANPTAGFTQWAYRNLDRVMAPFRGIFTPISLGSTTADVPAIFDTSVLFAMIVYGILALLMSWVIHWLTDRLMRLDALEDDIERRQYEQAQRDAIAGPGRAGAADVRSGDDHGPVPHRDRSAPGQPAPAQPAPAQSAALPAAVAVPPAAGQGSQAGRCDS